MRGEDCECPKREIVSFRQSVKGGGADRLGKEGGVRLVLGKKVRDTACRDRRQSIAWFRWLLLNPGL